ncbi:MAG: class I SAM-dependent methyltransferase [Proteobacteria bacterium]|nr:class I SAM-dependent methyltransferase [Pseudomonadota bacterium]
MKSHNWLVHKLILIEIQESAKKYAKGIMLDIGCGNKPYESVFAPYIEKHIGLDHQDSLHGLSRVDIIATAYNTTLPDKSVDTILCTDVLEHIERPWDAVKEMYRVLKPGGYLILTVPLFWHLHEEPRDFYRYTKHGLTYLLESSEFEIVELKPFSGFLVTFGQELVYFLLRFRRGFFFRWIIDTLSFLIQLCSYFLNRFDRSYQFTFDYLAVARKPD